MSRRYSPASLRLAAIGVTHERIATRAGVERGTITMQLIGQNPPQPYLFAAIRSVAGADVAADIAEILGYSEPVSA